MIIETTCRRCPTWVRIVAPDTTTEAEAAKLAGRCYCLACGIERMVAVTAHHKAMRDTSRERTTSSETKPRSNLPERLQSFFNQ